MLLTLIVVAALVIAAAALVVFAVVVVGIRGDERQMSLSVAPRTRTRAIARRFLGVHATSHRTVHRTHADTRR